MSTIGFLLRRKTGHAFSALVAVIASVLLGGQELSVATPHEADLRPNSLLIAPNISGAAFCPEAEADRSISNEVQAEALCRHIGSNAAPAIKAALDAIGPVKSPSGAYELGYTLSFSLLSFYEREPGGWRINEKTLRTAIRTIADVDRPVVVYLSANHFGETAAELSRELSQDTRNLMWVRNGPLKPDNYFMVPVYAWTLTDQNASINVMRRQAFNAVLNGICALPASQRKRVAAISILGEVHQLYPDFFSGMSYKAGFDITDYSPSARKGFKDWLRQKYPTIDAFNRAAGTRFQSFDVIEPPSRSALVDKSVDASEHIDGYAAGILPIYGWAYDPAGGRLTVRAYIDGRLSGSAPADLNRTDVPQADKSIGTPNVGWRINFDYRELTPGWHILDLAVLNEKGQEWTFGRRQFWIADPKVPTHVSPMLVDDGVDNLDQQSVIRANPDGPAPGLNLLYNPLARLWLEYRNRTVRDYYEVFAGLARKSCIPHDRIFSHQITPQLNPTWDSDLMAVDASQLPSSSYLPGSTLYGGAAFGDAFFRWKKALGWTRYSVPEMHPNFRLSRGEMESMFERHRMNGAVFVAPYFLSIVPKRINVPPSDLYDYRISPDNPRYGSDTYYEAISDLMRNH